MLTLLLWHYCKTFGQRRKQSAFDLVLLVLKIGEKKYIVTQIDWEKDVHLAINEIQIKQTIKDVNNEAVVKDSFLLYSMKKPKSIEGVVATVLHQD